MSLREDGRKGTLRIEVDVREALAIRRHVGECMVCFIAEMPVCSEGVAMVEDALDVAGLYDLQRETAEGAKR